MLLEWLISTKLPQAFCGQPESNPNSDLAPKRERMHRPVPGYKESGNTPIQPESTRKHAKNVQEP